MIGYRISRARGFALVVAVLLMLSLAACNSPVSSTTKTSSGSTPTTSSTGPTVNAGSDQTVTYGADVSLTGTGSDPDGYTLTYAWSFASQPTGSNETVSDILNATSLNASFYPTNTGVYVMELAASDGSNTASSTVTITVNAVNSAPTIVELVASPQAVVATNTTVALTGEGADTDSDLLTYSWTITSQPTGAGLTAPADSTGNSSASTCTQNFTLSVAGTYVIQFSVSDGVNAAVSKSITLTAQSASSGPIANAGSDATVDPMVDSTYQLDGSQSGEAGTTVTYSWALTSAPSTFTGTVSSILSSTTIVNPVMTTTVPHGDYTFELTVTDTNANTATADVTITVKNDPPVIYSLSASANSVNVDNAGAQVTLTASAGDFYNQDPLSYTWSIVSKPSGSTLTATSLGTSSTATATLDQSITGTYVFECTVSDGLASASSQVSVTATTSSDGTVGVTVY